MTMKQPVVTEHRESWLKSYNTSMKNKAIQNYITWSSWNNLNGYSPVDARYREGGLWVN